MSNRRTARTAASPTIRPPSSSVVNAPRRMTMYMRYGSVAQARARARRSPATRGGSRPAASARRRRRCQRINPPATTNSVSFACSVESYQSRVPTPSTAPVTSSTRQRRERHPPEPPRHRPQPSRSRPAAREPRRGRARVVRPRTWPWRAGAGRARTSRRALQHPQVVPELVAVPAGDDPALAQVRQPRA